MKRSLAVYFYSVLGGFIVFAAILVVVVIFAVFGVFASYIFLSQ